MRLIEGIPCEHIDYTGARIRGVVRYVGRLRHATGIWVGISLPTPDGDTDGTHKGRLYLPGPTKMLHSVFRPKESVTAVLEGIFIHHFRSSVPGDGTFLLRMNVQKGCVDGCFSISPAKSHENTISKVLGVSGEVIEGIFKTPRGLATQIHFHVKRRILVETDPHTGESVHSTPEESHYSFEGQHPTMSLVLTQALTLTLTLSLTPLIVSLNHRRGSGLRAGSVSDHHPSPRLKARSHCRHCAGNLPLTPVTTQRRNLLHGNGEGDSCSYRLAMLCNGGPLGALEGARQHPW